MATTDSNAEPAFAEVMNAVSSMYDRLKWQKMDTAQKKATYELLEKFQKSPEAWQILVTILKSEAALETKTFAASTLKGKITYDISQLPRAALSDTRTYLLKFISQYAKGPLPIRDQLCACLAVLSIQMTEWNGVLETVVSTVGADEAGTVCIFEFLKALPQEIAEAQNTPFINDELSIRTRELLGENSEPVLSLLIQFSQSSSAGTTSPHILDCIRSWSREIPVIDVIESPLLDCIFSALDTKESFDPAVQCLCAILTETGDVDEHLDAINILFPKVLLLLPRIATAAEANDSEVFKGVRQLIVQAGEAWCILILRMPAEFRVIVEAICECAARDTDKSTIGLAFWNNLSQCIMLEGYTEARVQLADIFADLLRILIKQLEFPTPDDPMSHNLFDGDREREKCFWEVRQAMGDCIKNCSVVLGVSDCLNTAYGRVEAWMTEYGAGTPGADEPVANWQVPEASLYSLLAMGSIDEDEVLPRFINLMLQLPEHKMLRLATLKVIGRYTEWTSNHIELLELQLGYVTNSFVSSSEEVRRAAATALKMICTDCRHSLRGHVDQLHKFYEQVQDELPQISREELLEGVASVVAVQPLSTVYDSLRLCCEPLFTRMMLLANQGDELSIAHAIQLFNPFTQRVVPTVEHDQVNPAVSFWQEIFPVLAEILDNFIKNQLICECVCRCWQNLLTSQGTAMEPLLPIMEEKLVTGFSKSTQGCFLSTTATIIREFADCVDTNTNEANYQFLQQQSWITFKMLADSEPRSIPDVIESFFRLHNDAILVNPMRVIPSQLFEPTIKAGLAALVLERREPLTATLQYLRNIIAFGGSNPPVSTGQQNDLFLRQVVCNIARSQGEILVIRLMTGMMYSFPRDCFDDCRSLLLGLVELLPEETIGWVAKAIVTLPTGTVSAQESQKFLVHFQQAIISRESRVVKSTLEDFTDMYRRRYVDPRDGLVKIEGDNT